MWITLSFISFETVPIRPALMPSLSKMRFVTVVMVVLPFVPVTPISVSLFCGFEKKFAQIFACRAERFSCMVFEFAYPVQRIRKR